MQGFFDPHPRLLSLLRGERQAVKTGLQVSRAGFSSRPCVRLAVPVQGV